MKSRSNIGPEKANPERPTWSIDLEGYTTIQNRLPSVQIDGEFGNQWCVD